MNKIIPLCRSDAEIMRDPEFIKACGRYNARLLVYLARVVRRGRKLSPEDAQEMKLFLAELIEEL